MIKLYKNRDWLYDQYWNKEKSQYQIAKKCGTCFQLISYWMKKFNISSRPINKAIHLAKANYCQLSQEAIEFINGELLGDGNLSSVNNYSARICYSSKYEEYINYISNTLKSFGIEQSGKINKKYWGKNLFQFNFSYQSCSYEELKDIYKKWYPNGRKIVPKNIKLTPSTCRQWYVGDGCLVKFKKCNPYIMLYTNGFLKGDVKWLVQQLNKLGFKATRQSYRNIVRISVYSTQDFLNYIGECSVRCYQYKWKVLTK